MRRETVVYPVKNMDSENNEDRIAALEKRIGQLEKTVSSVPAVLTQMITMFEKSQLGTDNSIVNIEDILINLSQINAPLLRWMATSPQLDDDKLRQKMIDVAAKVETQLDQLRAANEEGKRRLSALPGSAGPKPPPSANPPG